MSTEKDDTGVSATQNSPTVVCEKQTVNKPNQPFPSNYQDLPRDLIHKAKAPAVPVSEEIEVPAKTTSTNPTNETVEVKVEDGDGIDRVNIEMVVEVTEKPVLSKDADITSVNNTEQMTVPKQPTDEIISNKEKNENIILGKKLEPSSEVITITSLNIESKTASVQPISEFNAITDTESLSVIELKETKHALENKKEKEEIIELSSPMPTSIRKGERNDEMESSELLSRHSAATASDFAGAVRRLFCCGVRYRPPSEDNISSNRDHGI